MDFTHYWQYTYGITKTLFIILVLLSLMSWTVGVLRLIQSYRFGQVVQQTLQQTITESLQKDQAKLSLLSVEARKNVVEQRLVQQINRYRFASEKGLSVLGTTAAIAPFIGLFGTVWGIFHALRSIGATGQAGLGQVAGPVGEALIMTGLGLSVAIPAVVFYNIAIRLNRQAIHTANDTAHSILANSLLSIQADAASVTTNQATQTATKTLVSSPEH